MVRRAIFWLHLIAGVCVGFVVLIMSVTGTVLTYERQLIAWTTSHLRSAVPATGVAPMTLESLLEHASAARPGLVPAGITVNSEVDAPVTILAEPSPVFVDAYSGQELGERRGAALRTFLATMRSWHRWLGAEGENRAAARSITGWSNLLFLFIIVTGLYLWVPRTFRWLQVRQVVWFKRAYGTSKARDFNWHHVIGIWAAVPLFVIVLGAVPMSFPWANDALYRVAGEAPPARAGAGTPGGARVRPSVPSLEGLDAAVARARAESPEWRTLSVRFPRRADDPLAVTIDTGNGGQPQRRATLTVTRSGAVVSREGFADQPRGRQLRSLLRFAHTGELFGIGGQAVAGLATAGASVMVWTGLALSWRRLAAWRARRRERGSFTAIMTDLHEVYENVRTAKINAVSAPSDATLPKV